MSRNLIGLPACLHFNVRGGGGSGGGGGTVWNRATLEVAGGSIQQVAAQTGSRCGRYCTLPSVACYRCVWNDCEFWETLGKVNETTNKRRFLKYMYLSPGQKTAPAEKKKKKTHQFADSA